MDTPISGNLHFSRKKNCSLGRIKTFWNLRLVLLNASVSMAERQVGHDMIWWGLVVWSVSTTDGVLDLQHSRCKLNEDGWLLDLSRYTMLYPHYVPWIIWIPLRYHHIPWSSEVSPSYPHRVVSSSWGTTKSMSIWSKSRLLKRAYFDSRCPMAKRHRCLVFASGTYILKTVSGSYLRLVDDWVDCVTKSDQVVQFDPGPNWFKAHFVSIFPVFLEEKAMVFP